MVPKGTTFHAKGQFFFYVVFVWIFIFAIVMIQNLREKSVTKVVSAISLDSPKVY